MRWLLLLAVTAVSCPVAGGAGNLYFTDRGAKLVRRSSFDGTSLETIIVGDATSNLRGIALDVPRETLFYADNGLDIIFRTDLDGSDRVPVIENGLGFPADVAVDTANAKIYWCDRNNGRIERADYDGAMRETVVATDEPYFLELDLAGGKIYWGDFGGGNILRADIADGANSETVVSGLVQTRGVKIDAGGGYLYWCDRNAHKVQRRRIDGGTVEDLYTGLDTPHGLTLDIPAGKAYWADTGTNNVAGSVGAKAVNRGDMDGSGPHEVLAGVDQPWDLDLDRSSTRYDVWVQRRFPAGAPPADTGRSVDLDGDFLTNLQEYYFIRDPFTPDAAGLTWPVRLEMPPGPALPALAYRRRGGVTDVADAVEVSDDLVAWQRGATVTLPPVIEKREDSESEGVTVGVTLGGGHVSARVAIE